jgi:hypothetical protein
MGTSITSWEDVSAYFTFADSPIALYLFALGAAGIVTFLIGSIMKHEKKAFAKK